MVTWSEKPPFFQKQGVPWEPLKNLSVALAATPDLKSLARIILDIDPDHGCREGFSLSTR